MHTEYDLVANQVGVPNAALNGVVLPC